MKDLTLATITEEQKEELFNFLGLAHGIGRDRIELVGVKPVPKHMNWMVKQAKFKMCFNNSFDAVARTMGAKYVLGFGLSIIPVEHAWVQIEGVYYDPTWEKHSALGGVYAKVIELDLDELAEVMNQNDETPPSLYDLRRLGYFK